LFTENDTWSSSVGFDGSVGLEHPVRQLAGGEGLEWETLYNSDLNYT
jgi:hypothetical protein